LYHLHSSDALIELFESKPYQGVEPHRTKFLFVGLDANYSDTIESDPVFEKILEYHRDGAGFWRKYGVHHPFLLSGYRGSGRFYHKSFSEVGFGPEHAYLVSFAELLHVPTTGQSKLEVDDLDLDHMKKMASWVLEGDAEFIFFPAGVARLLKRLSLFSWIPKTPLRHEGALKVLLDQPKKHVYQHLHFSNYGRFLEQKRREAADIRSLLKAST
jgi:hypothetical protein